MKDAAWASSSQRCCRPMYQYFSLSVGGVGTAKSARSTGVRACFIRTCATKAASVIFLGSLASGRCPSPPRRRSPTAVAGCDGPFTSSERGRYLDWVSLERGNDYSLCDSGHTALELPTVRGRPGSGKMAEEPAGPGKAKTVDQSGQAPAQKPLRRLRYPYGRGVRRISHLMLIRLPPLACSGGEARLPAQHRGVPAL